MARARIGAPTIDGGSRSGNGARQPAEGFFIGDPKKARALRLFNRGDWGSLYKIFEIIYRDVGLKVYDDEWLQESQIRLFKCTANNLRAIGDEARHAREDWDPPGKPMSLPEARKLIQALLKRWICYKR